MHGECRAPTGSERIIVDSAKLFIQRQIEVCRRGTFKTSRTSNGCRKCVEAPKLTVKSPTAERLQKLHFGCEAHCSELKNPDQIRARKSPLFDVTKLHPGDDSVALNLRGLITVLGDIPHSEFIF